MNDKFLVIQQRQFSDYRDLKNISFSYINFLSFDSMESLYVFSSSFVFKDKYPKIKCKI